MKLTAKKREETGSSAAARYRREGLIPAAVYSKGTETISVLLEEKKIEEVIREMGRQAVFNIDVEGDKTQQVYIKEVQKEALEDALLHVSLQAIKAGEKIMVEVPVTLTDGDNIKTGILDQQLYEVSVEATPSNIPSEYTLSVGELEIGDSLAISDLEAVEGVEIQDEPETLVAQVLPPAEEEPTEPVEVEEGAEPEVIGETEDSE